MAAPPTKRPRTETAIAIKVERPAIPPLELPHHPRLWYDDGDVILTTSTMIFKVYRIVLKLHSRHLSNVVSADAGNASMECPRYTVEDSQENLDIVLDWIFRRAASRDRSDRPNFKLCVKYLALGNQYGIDSMIAEGASYLRRSFPSRLVDYDRVVQSIALSDADRFPYLFTAEAVLYFLGALLAHHYGILNALPSALLICCSFSEEESFNTVEEVVQLVGRDHPCVSDSNQLWLFRRIGLSRAMFASRQLIDTEAFGRAEDCSTPEACDAGLFALGIVDEDDMPLSPFYEQLASSEELSSSCHSCRRRWEWQYEAARKQFWKNLPERFELSSWGEMAENRG